MFGRSFLLGLAWAALLVFLSPALASAASREQSPGPKALLEEFPLNPTGERIVSPTYARPGVFRPPVQPAAAHSPGTDLFFLAAIGGGSVVALLALVGLASVLLRSVSSRGVTTGAQEKPSAYISAVFMGTRRLPVIEGRARRKRRVAWTTEIVRVLVACAVVLVVGFLIVQYVG